MEEKGNMKSEMRSLDDEAKADSLKVEDLGQTPSQEGNLFYDGEEEPEIHMRTWIALASMFLLNLVQVFALQGPPAVVGKKVNMSKPCIYTT